MSLLKTSFLSGISVLVKVFSALVLNKILAVYVGPSGYAIIGQLQNVVSIAANIAGGAISTGITRLTAQNFDDAAYQQAVWRTATRITLAAAGFTSLCLVLFHASIGEIISQKFNMKSVVLWLAAATPAIALNNLLLAVLNGRKEVRIFVISNISGSIISLSIASALTVCFGLYGAFVALVVSPAVVLIVTAWLVTKGTNLNLKKSLSIYDKKAARSLFSYGLMGLTTAIVAPVSAMAVREILTNSIDLESAGYWQASWKISEIYLMLITTTLSVYYLPRLAEIRTSRELTSEIAKVYKLILPVTIACASIIYFMRDFIITSLFTKDFLPMQSLFLWQLIGDVIKIGSWIPAYIMLGRGLAKIFIISEVIFAASLIALTLFFVNSYGLIGAPMAYALNYIVYWIFAANLLQRESRKM